MDIEDHAGAGDPVISGLPVVPEERAQPKPLANLVQDCAAPLVARAVEENVHVFFALRPVLNSLQAGVKAQRQVRDASKPLRPQKGGVFLGVIPNRVRGTENLLAAGSQPALMGRQLLELIEDARRMRKRIDMLGRQEVVANDDIERAGLDPVHSQRTTMTQRLE